MVSPQIDAHKNAIRLRGGRMHNLRNVDVDIPLGKLIVVCGVSGSGKTSLALDTLFAEGQRRYIESFAPKLRRYLPKPDRPEYDSLESLPASIALKRRSRVRNERACVGTITELDDYLRILFAGLGALYCPGCGQRVVRHDAAAVADWLAGQTRRKAMTTFAVQWKDPTELAMNLADFQQAGLVRFLVGGRQWNLDALDRSELAQAVESVGGGLVVVDRIMTGENTPRLLESAETAFDFGDDRLEILTEADGTDEVETNVVEIDGVSFRRYGFSRNLECRSCDRRFPIPEPDLFHFESPLGACPECNGDGRNLRKPAERDESCSACGGARINDVARSYRIGEVTISAARSMTIGALDRWLSSDETFQNHRSAFGESLEELSSRLEYLKSVGLGYLSLDRRATTLSSGESTRVELTGILGSSLVDMLYVLDEPTIGLHPNETQPLLEVVERLRDRGNTVILVEHEPEIMKRADHLIELGPGAGKDGGIVCFTGSFTELTSAETLTGRFFQSSHGTHKTVTPDSSPVRTGERRQEPASTGEEGPPASLRLTGATGRHLKNMTVELPIGAYSVITGVSGSGKSSLLMETLVPAVRRALGDATARPLPYETLSGYESLSGCAFIDTTPPAQSSRSSPASYTKLFDDLRKLYASTQDAKRLHWSTGHFSHNSVQGQCPRCLGDGRLIVDMQFMSDIDTECPDCRGSGYRHEVLAVKYRDRSIAECLAMSVDEAEPFFRGQPRIQRKLRRLSELGLGYLAIGQRLSTLSSGELQRLKLAEHLMESQASMLFIMDEPTTGLHFADVDRLLKLVGGLVQAGNTVVVIEHNVGMIEAADYVVDLGPGPGEAGGRIVAQGSPRDIAAATVSLTGRYLFRS